LPYARGGRAHALLRDRRLGARGNHPRPHRRRGGPPAREGRMRFADVLGHDAAIERLRRAAATQRLAGAYLLTGPAGVGKRLLADAFAARILCAAPRDDDACGTCAQCTRVAAGTHPELRLLERDEERRDIRIEQIRELSRWLALQPLMAERKVAIVDGAHCLSEPAQNALLKTLEEPPPSAVLLLTTPAAALLLPTVRSRCQRVRLDPLPLESVARVLAARGVVPEQATLLAAEAEGSPGRALASSGDEEVRFRDAMVGALRTLRTLDAAALSTLAQDLARGPADGALAAAAAWYRDVLVLVETERGPELGTVAVPARPLRKARTLQRVIKKADSRDLGREDQNFQRERASYHSALELVRGSGLPMKLVKAERTYDGTKTTFYFFAEDRVDFRELARTLSQSLGTRVEMKQIGARDEAKVAGGLGVCGR